MDLAVIIGLAAGFLTTVANIPQLYKSWKTKSTRDLSLTWLIILGLGIILWLIYGFTINSLPLILANIVTLIIVLGMIALKLKYQ
ncbi:SemiSWEET transporter [archaeon]|nr:SemiSWEET transporter [archaeon]